MRHFIVVCLTVAVGIEIETVASAVDYSWTNSNEGLMTSRPTGRFFRHPRLKSLGVLETRFTSTSVFPR